MSLPTNHPISPEVLDAMKRYNAGRQDSIDRRKAEIARDIAERTALSAQLEEAGNELFDRLINVLPEDQKKLFLWFSSVQVCQYEVKQFRMDRAQLKIVRGLLASARKLLYPKTRAPKKSRRAK